MRYGIFGLLLIVVMVLGVGESSLAWPVFAVGILVFAVSDLVWWQRLLTLWLAGLIWSSSMLISAWTLILILYGAAWSYRWLMRRMSVRQSLTAVTSVSVLIIGGVQGVSVTLTSLILYVFQAWLFWHFTRLVSYKHTNALVFFVPPQSLSSNNTHDKS